MDTLSLDRALALARQHGGNRVSIFMPTRPFAPGSQEGDTTRLRNLLRDAETELIERGARSAEVASLLGPARSLAEDRPFWLRATEGLAVLLGPEGMEAFRVAGALPEMVRVGDSFYLRPLLGFLEDDRPFKLLAISQGKVRLFEGTRDSFGELSPSGMPASLAEAMRWDDFEKDSLQYHTNTPATIGGRAPAVFHGTGETAVKDELVRFFTALDHAIHAELKESQEPLILAGVGYLLPIYRDVNTYPRLVEETITGNPDALTLPVLQQRARDILTRLERADRQRLAQGVEDAWGSAKTTPDPETIVPAAHAGRVDTLLFTGGEEWWGTYDETAQRISLHRARAEGDEDLLGLAAMRTLENGGSVVELPAEEMPHREGAVALLRY